MHSKRLAQKHRNVALYSAIWHFSGAEILERGVEGRGVLEGWVENGPVGKPVFVCTFVQDTRENLPMSVCLLLLNTVQCLPYSG